MSKRIPGATYRLQFNHDFTFAQAQNVADYLHELGITDCYASPLFKARAESTHGYDACDFARLNPNLGAAPDFEKFVAHLRDLEMGLVLDVVPNHMSADTSNVWWFDVLKNGVHSQHANWFDIDWQRFGDNKVVLPVLEDELENVLTAGKLKLVFESNNFLIAYYDRHFPLSPQSHEIILEQVAKRGLDAVLSEFNGISGQPITFGRLNDLLQQQHYLLAYWRSGRINYRRFFDVNELVSLRMELPEVFDATHRLLSTLIQQGKVTGLRIDHPDGLWNPKQYLERLQEKFGPIYVVVEKILTDDEALSEDWPADGTTGYDFLNRLNGIFVNQSNKSAFDHIYGDYVGGAVDFHDMVYKSKKRILQNSFAGELNALTERLKDLCDPIPNRARLAPAELRKALADVIACFPVYRTYVTEETSQLSAVETNQVEHAMRIARLRLSGEEQGSAVNEEFSPAMPVQQESSPSVPKGRMKIAQHFNVGTGIPTKSSPEGTAEYENANPTNPTALQFIHDLLVLRSPRNIDDPTKRLQREFVMKFQQLTGPLMAKAVEDTTFYNFNRLLSLNEVGGNPDTFGNTLDDFHQHNRQKAQHWPHSLLATATHDTKRGEDVRARINVLSEIPGEWESALGRWQKLNSDKKSNVNGMPAPDSNDEYFFYQTLLGAWPAEASNAHKSGCFRDRVAAYMLKAIKESKANTSWTHPDPEYEAATQKFVEQTLEDSPSNAFLNDFKPFLERITFFGRLNSLSQVLLKVTSPGVPDFYQGTELWDLSLVDPDNRRSVDYEIRRQVLAEVKAQAHQSPQTYARLLADRLEDDAIGRSKLYLIWRLLEFRNRHRPLFDSGTYLPLTTIGAKKAYICAFARLRQDKIAIIVAPRFFPGLLNGDLRLPLGPPIWEDTALILPNEFTNDKWLNVVTGETVTQRGADRTMSLAEVIAQFPVALLERC